MNLPLKGEWLFLHPIINPAQIFKHIKMDWPGPAVLVGACYFINLYFTGLSLAFCNLNIGMGSILVNSVPQNKAKGLLFPFLFNPVCFAMGHFTIYPGTKLAGIKSYYNTFRKPENKGFYQACGIKFFQ